MHGAGGGEHGEFTAEGFALKKQISALSRMARETLGAIEKPRGHGRV